MLFFQSQYISLIFLSSILYALAFILYFFKTKDFLLQKGDEILNYKDAVDKLPNSNLKIEEGGNHSFEGIERYFNEIENFFS